jgi:heme a synthase
VTAFRSINLVALLLCFCVIVFGAYVRLADAGLGCPDWPGCYGHLDIPKTEQEIAHAENRFPERPVEAPKAWKEMIHRYLASTLGLLIVAMAVLSAVKRNVGIPRVLPWALVGLVIFQGILGMWTVTLQLKPLVVTGHLFGGLTTFSLLLWMWLATRHASAPPRPTQNSNLRVFAGAALFVLACQIFLGGWTSTNYAALACPDFPTCHGKWVPETDLGEAFTLWRGLGINYEFGVLDNRARVTIHYFHRIGAIVATLVLGALGLVLLLRGRAPLWRGLGGLVLGALAVQISIGIMTVKLQLPLLLAAAHNAGAALLVLALVSLNYHVHNAK